MVTADPVRVSRGRHTVEPPVMIHRMIIDGVTYGGQREDHKDDQPLSLLMNLARSI